MRAFPNLLKQTGKIRPRVNTTLKPGGTPRGKVIGIHPIQGQPQSVRVRLGARQLVAVAGRSGLTRAKREGDGATPIGRFRLLAAYYRADRISRPRTGLPLRRMRARDGWCDDPNSANYNRPVQLPQRACHEAMWRQDGLYDLVIVIDHNQRPRLRGGGSAIFLHVSSPNLQPTEGCIAFPLTILRRLMRCLRPGMILDITSG